MASAGRDKADEMMRFDQNELGVLTASLQPEEQN